MIVRAIKTRKVTSRACTLEELLNESISELSEGSVVAIASKVVSLCEGQVVPVEGTDKEALIAEQAQLFMPSPSNPYGVSLTVTRNLLVAAAGIDESNADNEYVLWPADAQASANRARAFLREKFGLKQVGVIITDSATRPFEWGTTGISIAYSGFEPLKDYIGQDDLFGRKLVYQKNNIQGGLAAAAATAMGEGSEQKPLAVLSDLDFVTFVDADPTAEELAALKIEPEADIYAPLLNHAPWHKGQGKA
ncbi:MAG TPA: coenzyme F420-0:L-glutamate ligase [Candidatus Pristimantibacillus sp.]|nr:coenzyme F420-0:L-glutamate ligase [Candidatus Pristimantibacillus sp.]